MKLYQGKYPISDETEYVIDYVYENVSGMNYYYQLVRLSDGAILASSLSPQVIKATCFSMGLHKQTVAFV